MGVDESNLFGYYPFVLLIEVTCGVCSKYGAIAQLGERLNGIQEVGGSIPPSSTPPFTISFLRYARPCVGPLLFLEGAG